MRQRHFLGLLALSLMLGACAGPMPIAPTNATRLAATAGKGTTSALYTYFALDNDLDEGAELSRFIIKDATQARRTSAAVFYDGRKKNDTAFMAGVPGQEPLLPAPHEMDTATVATLQVFLQQAKEAAPAQRRVLALSDHGGGIIRGICEDTKSATSAQIMYIPAIAKALQGTSFDVTLMDACFMNMAEVAYEMRPVTETIVAAQTETEGNFPYRQILAHLDDHPQQSTPALAKDLHAIVDRGARYTGVAFGAIDTRQTEPMAAAVKRLSQALIEHLPTHREAMREAIAESAAYANETERHFLLYNDYKDFGSVMAHLAAIPVPEIQQAAKEAKAAGRAAVLAQSFRNSRRLKLDETNGLALYATVSGSVERRYLTSAWAQDTGWGQFLVRLNSGRGSVSGGIGTDPYPFAFPSKRPRPDK